MIRCGEIVSHEGTKTPRKRETGLQDGLDVQAGGQGRAPMLVLANQSSCVSASELARRWLPDCFIRYAHDPIF